MNKEDIKISIVSPVYKSRETVSELVRRIVASVSRISEHYEIILVEDGCPNNSWDSIVEECKGNLRVKGVKLSRNFGQHYAITAGLDIAKGEWIVVMDCDLQDQPEEIFKLYNKAIEGFDYVQARRFERKDNWLKKKSSQLFNWVFSYLSGIKSESAVSNFGIYNRKVVQAFLEHREFSRSFPSLLFLIGFEYCYLDVEHANRLEGKSSYSLSKLIDLSLDIILSNSNKPLKITIKVGFLISILAFLLAIYNVIAGLLGFITVEGYTSTLFSIWFVGGLILTVLGIFGLYIGKIFDQVKERPLYIVSNKLNLEED